MSAQSSKDVAVSHKQSFETREETLQVLVAQALGSDSSYKPTERQVDKILELKEKAMQYTFQERTQMLPQHKFDTAIQLVYFFLLILLLVGVIKYKPEYTDKVLTGVLSFAAGYGVASSRNSKRKVHSKP